MTPTNASSLPSLTNPLLGSCIFLTILLNCCEVLGQDFIFESADVGRTGRFSGGGIGVSEDFFSGVRFELTEPAEIGSIGGMFSSREDGTIFGAVVELPGGFSYPDPPDLSGNDVLGTTLLELPPFIDGIQDISAPLELSLDPGWYALMFGSGKFGATGNATAGGENPNPHPTADIITLRQSDGFGIRQASDPRFYLAGPGSHDNSAPGTDPDPGLDPNLKTTSIEITAALDASVNCFPDPFGCFFDEGGRGARIQRIDEFNNHRGVIEFDLGALPSGSQIVEATVDLKLNSYTVGAGLEFYGYAGTGNLDDVDAANLGPAIGDSGFIEDFPVSVELDEDYVQGLVGTGANLGMLLLPSDGPKGANFDTIEAHEEFPQIFDPPTLRLEYAAAAGLDVASIVDLNNNGLDLRDLEAFCAILDLSPIPEFDLNMDGEIDHADADLVIDALGLTRGDTNTDGTVDFADFLTFSDSFGGSGLWSDGDFDCNNQVDFADFLLLSENFGVAAAASVPEPNSLLLLTTSLICLAGIRQRRQSDLR